MRNRFRSLIGLSVGLLLLASQPAHALNDIIQRSCDPDCAIKPPKENLFVRAVGDFDGSGGSPEISGTLAKGKKKTVVKVDLTYEWFSLSAQFRPFTVRINDKWPAGSAFIVNHLDSCPSGACTRTATYWFDIDAQEAAYPGQFYGQPLKVDLEPSAKAADAGSGAMYNATLSIQVLKKK